MYDIIIIGGGVAGCAAARELSRYKANICLVEKEEDVCAGTSKANSAIAHAGYDAEPGSLMAKLNVQGNQMMDAVARELDFPFERIGSMVVCVHEEDVYKLEEHNQVFLFMSGTGYVKTPRMVYNITEVAVFVPEFDKEKFVIRGHSR